MRMPVSLSRTAALAGVALLALGLTTGSGEERSQQTSSARAPAQAPAAPRRLDVTKTVGIERPPLEIVKNSAPAAAPTPPRADLPKRDAIERPTEALVRGRTSEPARGAEFVNPKVEPGKVRWHSTFAAARAAAAKSGKPVLLFQMMGKLDDQFC